MRCAASLRSVLEGKKWCIIIERNERAAPHSTFTFLLSFHLFGGSWVGNCPGRNLCAHRNERFSIRLIEPDRTDRLLTDYSSWPYPFSIVVGRRRKIKRQGDSKYTHRRRGDGDEMLFLDWKLLICISQRSKIFSSIVFDDLMAASHAGWKLSWSSSLFASGG